MCIKTIIVQYHPTYSLNVQPFARIPKYPHHSPQVRHLLD